MRKERRKGVGEERMREVEEKWVGGRENIKESMAINAGKNDEGKKVKYSREKGSVKVNEVTAQIKEL